jgi:hypothetical protein
MTSQYSPETREQATIIADLMFEADRNLHHSLLGWYHAVSDALGTGTEELPYLVAELSLILYRTRQAEATFGQVSREALAKREARAQAMRAQQQATYDALPQAAKDRIAARRADRHF